MARGIVWTPAPRNATAALGKKEFGTPDPFVLFQREALTELHPIITLIE